MGMKIEVLTRPEEIDEVLPSWTALAKSDGRDGFSNPRVVSRLDSSYLPGC